VGGPLSAAGSLDRRPAEVLVVGLGNPLMADDGVGHRVVELAGTSALPPHLRMMTVAGDILHLPELWRGEAGILFLDAVERGAIPGTIHRLGHDELLGLPQVHTSTHHLSLPECLRWLRLCEPRLEQVRCRLWGVEPAEIVPRRALAPPVERAAIRLAREIVTARAVA